MVRVRQRASGPLDAVWVAEKLSGIAVHPASRRPALRKKSMQVRLKLEYDGTNYAGWQLQSGQDSIQARLEEALLRLFGDPVRVRGAGRTDAGVHARGQVAAARLPRPFDSAELARALNAILPPDIVVLEASEVGDDFDPRRAALRSSTNTTC